MAVILVNENLEFMEDKTDIDFINPFLDELHGLSVLDIGCGRFHCLLSQLNKKYETKINSLVGLDKCEKVHSMEDGIEIINIDALQYLDQLQQQKDVIILSNFLHFYDWEEIKKILNQCNTKLSQSGFMYIKMLLQIESHTKSCYTKQELDSTAKKFNLLVQEENYDDRFYRVILKKEKI